MQFKKRFQTVIVLFTLFHLCVTAQTADITLTIPQFMSWTTPTNSSNVSTLPMASRIKKPNMQLNNSLDTNVRILYSPDGMNNFGPYIDSAQQFNLFNFTHWQYIDIMCWFGGSASDPIIMPSKAWVDAAHKNGVKIIGTIFFAPAVYGGSQATVQSFLQTDANGNYLAVQQLKDIANFYNFDGWIFNCETAVNSTVGGQIASMIAQLQTAYTGEVIWYDSMLQSGTISYQNRLNANNAYFFTHSTGLFTNYNWSNASTVTSSQSYANSISQSPYKVYTGADMWPTRNAQPAFTNYTWIDKIITNNVSKTSIAMFATNFTYNYSGFSNFNNDSTDYQNFYDAENKIFSGVDLNPFSIDATWKGLVNYVPVRTVNRNFPFETTFNTGHGLQFYNNGQSLATGSWHNLTLQSQLPSWTFYHANLNLQYHFNDAFNGGSSLSIKSTNANPNIYTIPLFSTYIITSNTALELASSFKLLSGTVDSIYVELTQKGNASKIKIPVSFQSNTTWTDALNTAMCNTNDTIISIALKVTSLGAFQLLCGKISINETTASGVAYQENPVITSYPNPTSGRFTIANLPLQERVTLKVYNLLGKLVMQQSLSNVNTHEMTIEYPGVYLLEINSNKKTKIQTIIVK